jgi:soluble lytic murein transglycosylase-like protein
MVKPHYQCLLYKKKDIFMAKCFALVSSLTLLTIIPAHCEPYRERIEHHAALNNVPFSLATAMIRIESRYNANARSGPNLGLGQISLGTAKSLGYKGSAQGLLNAETNLTYSIKYLAQAYRLAKGNTCGTVMRYQNGLGSTRMSAANRAYCAKVRVG